MHGKCRDVFWLLFSSLFYERNERRSVLVEFEIVFGMSQAGVLFHAYIQKLGLLYWLLWILVFILIVN